jgi:hypothetical protein
MPSSSADNIGAIMNLDQNDFIEEKLLNANLNWGVDDN